MKAKSKKAEFTPRDIAQEITDKIIAQLEAGTIPWLKPWKDSTSLTAAMPFNLDSKKPYQGINILMLWDSKETNGYKSNAWLTFNQAKERGGNVKKGEHGTPVIFWKFLDVADRESEEPGALKKIPMLKHFTVFNIEQCENVKMPEIPEAKPDDGDVLNAHEKAYALAKNSGADIRHGGNRAFFRHDSDFIQMPNAEQFTSPEFYYSTLLHELTHWTGHKARLDRTFGARFGDSKYAAEELVAEMGAAFLCAELGIEGQLQHNAAYIQSWLKILRGDKKAIMTAASMASKAAAYLQGRKAEEPEESEELKQAA